MKVDILKKGVGVNPSPSPGWANFSIMMGCTPKSGHCHYVCNLTNLWSGTRRANSTKKYQYTTHLNCSTGNGVSIAAKENGGF